MRSLLRNCLVAGALLTAIVLTCRFVEMDSPFANAMKGSRPDATAVRPELNSQELSASTPGSPQRMKSEVPSGAQHGVTPFAQFDDWAKRYIASSADERHTMLEQGVAIARERRVALAALIPANPREALDHAVPMVVRQNLPAEVVSQLEERVNTKAFFGVLGLIGENDSVPAIRREVRTDDGKRYDAFVYGRRAAQKTTEGAFLNGIAVDRALALDERPLRVLEGGELPDPAKPAVETCIVSGKSTPAPRAANGDPAPINEQTPAIEVAGTIHYLCSGGHILAAEEDLIAQEGSTGGPTKPTGSIPGSVSTGVRSLLWMRVAFPETNQDPQSETSSYDEARQVNDFFVENSFGNVYVQATVTPLLILPKTEAWYKEGDNDGAVLTDARAAAKAAGYDPANFDLDAVIYRNGPGGFAGQAYVGGKGCWLKSSSVGVACHEFGHNFGLWHANSWNTSGRSVIGDGVHVEYGNSFDTMGSANAGAYHFNTEHKNEIDWITDDYVHDIRQSGTYRIFAMDQPRLEPSRRYALKVRKDSDRDYWCELRQKFTSNAWLMSGLSINWSPWAQSAGGAHLLDMTPGSPDDKTDSALVVGRTFSDWQAGVHITPIGKGGTTPESMDVVVNIGTFPSNQSPTVAISASATTVGANTNVTFTAAANDPDGDAISYAWDFGDKTFSAVNAAVVTKSWSTAGEYVVRCTASDMKGGTASSSLVVRVGSPNTFRISGAITFNGQPLPNVRVHNGLTGTSYRGSFTDSDGTYTISGLAAGTYTVGASLYGFGFGTQSATVGPNATNINFAATETPVVSIAFTDSDCRESGVNTGTFRISRTGSNASALTVNLFSPTGTATKTTDYTLSPDVTSANSVYTLTIPAGSDFLDVVVTPVDDTTAEGPETVKFELIPGTGYALDAVATATLTIADSDSTLPVVSLRSVDTLAKENGDPGSFIVTRTGATTSSLTIQFSVATGTGTATNGTDYTSIGTNVVIPAGASSATITINPIQDTAIEGSERVTLTISSNAAYIKDSRENSGTLYIEDDDQPTVTIAATDASAAEAGSDPGTFVVTRTGSTATPLTVYYTLGGSAHHGTDYLPLPGVLTIPAGSSVGSFTIVPIDDDIGEPQQTVVAQLRAGSGYVVGTAANATVNIADNDLPVVSLVITDGTMAEPNDTGTVRFTTTGTGSGNITVHYTVTGTATSGVDYQTLSGTVSMGKNSTSDLVITPIDDTAAEDGETVIVTIDTDPAYTIGLDSSATVLLRDNESPVVFASPAASPMTESGTAGKFYISRAGSTTNALTVSYTMSGTATSGSDYTALPGSVTIAAAATGAFIDVTPIQDALAEGTETVTMNIAPGSYSVGAPSATIYLSDDDTISAQVRFSSSTGSGAESAGTVNVPVTLSAASATPVTVEYRVNGGNAVNGVDYEFTNGTLTFAPGETSKTLPLAIIDDQFVEPNQTVVLQLLNANGAGLGTSTYTYTINDNDSVPGVTIGFATTAASGLESVTAPNMVVSLSAAQSSVVTVDYAVTGGTATAGTDYAINNGTLTFAVGETAKTIPCTITDDAISESAETIILTLSNPTVATLGPNSTHTYTITDDDAATVTVAASDATATESGDPGQFTFTRTGSITSALTVNIGIGGTATNGADYQALGATINFAANASTATLNVLPYLDGLNDGDETVVASIQPGSGYTIGASNSATVTIAENAALVTIAATDASAGEAGVNPGAFTITRLGDKTDAVTVNVTLSGTATLDTDYTTSAIPVTIAAGASSAVLTITPIDDAAPEVAETVIATIGAGSGYIVGAPSSASMTIVDDDSNFAPTITLMSPTKTNIGIPSGVGLLLEADVDDDGKPANPGTVSLTWTKQSGPGTVTFGSPNLASTTARFSLSGTYVLRLTANDGELQSTKDVTVQVGGAAPLVGINVNGATPTGSSSVSNGTYTVKGGGNNITASSDDFYFLQQSISGDVDIRARLVSMSGGGNSAKAGVMFRNDTTGGSRMAYMSSYSATSTNGSHSFRVRTSENTAIVNAGITGTATFPRWLRAVRSGNDFSGYISTDGQTWTQVGSTQTFTANSQMLIGLAVTSNSTSALCTAVFDNVTISTWPTNLGATVDAGANQSITLPASASLAGTVSDDGKPQPPAAVTLAWSKANGPGSVTFANQAAASTSATFAIPGDYVLRLSADDSEVKTFDEVTITTTQPTVAVQATDATAGELGAATGTFTLTRTGSTAGSLDVQITLSGTAVNGEDYNLVDETVSFASGQAAKNIVITPTDDGVAEGPETVVLTILDGTDYGVGATATATVTIDDLPIDSWRFAQFGTDANNSRISGDLVDLDLDGLPNILEYAFGTNPDAADAAPQLIGMEGSFLTLTYQRAVNAADLTFAVEESSAVGAWSLANATEQVLGQSGGIQTVKAQVPAGASGQKFLRLKVSRQ